MLWVLASLFTGYARCCNGPEPFLPTTTPAAVSAIAKKKGAKKGNTRKHATPGEAAAVSIPNSPEATSKVPKKEFRGVLCPTSSRVPDPLPEAKGTYVISSHTVLTKAPAKPTTASPLLSTNRKDDAQKGFRHSQRTVSVVGKDEAGVGSHSANTSRHSLAKGSRAAQRDASGVASLLGRHHATPDDTPADMDVYLGLCDPDVPASDGGGELHGGGARPRDGDINDDEADEVRRAREEAELEAATAEVANAEERAMERRRRLRLLRSGLLTPKEERRLRSDDVDDEEEDRGEDSDSSSSSTSSSSAATPLGNQPDVNNTTAAPRTSHHSVLSVPGAAGEKRGRQRGGGHKRASFISGTQSHHNGTTGGASHRDAGLVRTAEEQRGRDQEQSLAGGEADFWREDPVTEGVIPAPADIGADTDDDEDADEYARRHRTLERSKGGENDSHRSQPVPRKERSRSTKGAPLPTTALALARTATPTTMRTRKTCTTAARGASAVFSNTFPTAAPPLMARRRAPRPFFMAAAGRRNTAEQRGLSGYPVGGASEAVTAAVVGPEEEGDGNHHGVFSPDSTGNSGRHPLAGHDQTFSPASSLQRPQGAGGGGGDGSGNGTPHGRDGGPFSSTSPASHHHQTGEGSASAAHQPASGGGGGGGGDGRSAAMDSLADPTTTSLYAQRQQQKLQKLADKDRFNKPDPMFPSLANKGPAQPPQVRPPSPPLAPQGLLDPYVSRPMIPLPSSSEPQHFKGSGKLYFDLQTKHTR
ncbi:uncharacterized protein LOC126766617 [Bactrocera neohumeralis]|uniref:uncharacterized protein LOC126766617 n=1 Tax=Bactrocera neohumeralis TaxID=98809 RepID=UPI00216562FE|nr:uncharacterized protein LOC126766617 [Bactrocera neohumeralis]